MKRVALVTCAAALPLDEDLPPLVAALRARGYAAETPLWDDAAIDWRGYCAILLRSTWDYAERLPEFLRWAERTARLTQLCNSLDIVRWNTDKHYLLALEQAGVPIVPTSFWPEEGPMTWPEGEFVVKPAVGAGSRGAKRFRADEHAPAAAHARALRAGGACPMVQPYLASVDAQGETALVYFAGGFDHAVRKGPLLAAGAGDVRGLFAPETIDARTPGDDELRVGNKACSAIAGMKPLYARVDLIRDAAGSPRVLELELAEPSLYFHYSPGSADRFAALIAERLGI